MFLFWIYWINILLAGTFHLTQQENGQGAAGMSDSIITAVSHFYRATEEKHRGYFVLHFCKGNVEGNYFHV